VAARRPPARSGETYRYRGRTFPKPPGVDAALRRYRSDLRWCAQLLLKRNPGDRGKRIRITLNVTAHGRVSHVYVSGEVDRWRMAWCLKRRASRWRLPAQRLWYTHQFHMTL
jgi:hypothetical protein